MTHKDYTLIALALHSAIPEETSNVHYDASPLEVWNACCENIAAALLVNDLKFDKQQFLKTCNEGYC